MTDLPSAIKAPSVTRTGCVFFLRLAQFFIPQKYLFRARFYLIITRFFEEQSEKDQSSSFVDLAGDFKVRFRGMPVVVCSSAVSWCCESQPMRCTFIGGTGFYLNPIEGVWGGELVNGHRTGARRWWSYFSPFHHSGSCWTLATPFFLCFVSELLHSSHSTHAYTGAVQTKKHTPKLNRKALSMWTEARVTSWLIRDKIMPPQQQHRMR